MTLENCEIISFSPTPIMTCDCHSISCCSMPESVHWSEASHNGDSSQWVWLDESYVCVTYSLQEPMSVLHIYSLREPYVCVTYSLQFFHPYCILICRHSFSECCFSTACIYALSTLMDDRLCCSLILAKASPLSSCHLSSKHHIWAPTVVFNISLAVI